MVEGNGVGREWLVISNKNKERCASICNEATRPFTNHPVCAAKERDPFILWRSLPHLLLELKNRINEISYFHIRDF